METHETIARGIESAVRRGHTPALEVRACARQGDLMIRRVEMPAGQTSYCLAVLAAGNHGQHIALGDMSALASVRGRTRVYVGEAGAVVVHTDEPNARHGALRLSPGGYECWGLRELDGGKVVTVRD